MKRVLSLMLLLATVYLAACAGLFVFQRELIYHPTPAARAPADALMTLQRPDAQLRVSLRAAQGGSALLYFGGNAEDVSYSVEQLARLFPGHAIHGMHYRGYGGSSGKPSETALVQDALALFDTVQAQHPDIAVVGRSLGSGVAIQLANQRPLKALALVTPFDSLQDIAADSYRLFPVRWLLQDKFESWRYAKGVKVPTLLLVAEQDTLIPPASSARLLTHFAPGVASLKTVPGAEHNDISAYPLYGTLLQQALR